MAQSQAGAAAFGAGACPVGAAEAVENAFNLVAGHSRALVRELQDGVVVLDADADADRRAGRGVGDGGADEVRGGLAQPGLVTEDGSRTGPSAAGAGEVDGPPRVEGTRVVQRVHGQGARVHRRQAQRQGGGAKSRRGRWEPGERSCEPEGKRMRHRAPNTRYAALCRD